MIYLTWLLPLIVCVILWFQYKNKVESGILFGAFVVSMGIIVIYTIVHTLSAKSDLTKDIEWWGNYAVKVHYYEDWNERVSCRHPIYCTTCNTDNKGNTTCHDYVCGHMHLYDVDYHPEYWTIEFDDGFENQISQKEYRHWVKLWGGNTYKVDLNRNYHTDDGDDIVCNWDQNSRHSHVEITQHTYKNKVIASNSIFKPEHINTSEIKKYKLFEYPKLQNGKQKVILGLKPLPSTDTLLQYINGFYGPKKQFKLFICVWFDQPIRAAEKQRAYWQNLNKNEFLICLGLNKDFTINWCQTYSWMDKPILSEITEQYFSNQKKLNLSQFAKWFPQAVDQHWKRKRFRDFEYLDVSITQSQYMIIFIVTFILSIAQYIALNKIFKDE